MFKISLVYGKGSRIAAEYTACRQSLERYRYENGRLHDHIAEILSMAGIVRLNMLAKTNTTAQSTQTSTSPIEPIIRTPPLRPDVPNTTTAQPTQTSPIEPIIRTPLLRLDVPNTTTAQSTQTSPIETIIRTPPLRPDVPNTTTAQSTQTSPIETIIRTPPLRPDVPNTTTAQPTQTSPIEHIIRTPLLRLDVSNTTTAQPTRTSPIEPVIYTPPRTPESAEILAAGSTESLVGPVTPTTTRDGTPEDPFLETPLQIGLANATIPPSALTRLLQGPLSPLTPIPETKRKRVRQSDSLSPQLSPRKTRSGTILSADELTERPARRRKYCQPKAVPKRRK
ncbi:hypothetical protein PLEOSDRAFT_1106574 [Pleurotus ostreatus PC15]|uniref:Uncharacterized protein n=1 Tax=Pleurotus ostreatus (strain PC15) TaxID=1137138 RepID=A0A067NCS5_PLEO1|nr:hypothetical protein PLEOSDRAFT_1106574 [Pleurotus ostreatus PC15]